MAAGAHRGPYPAAGTVGRTPQEAEAMTKTWLDLACAPDSGAVRMGIGFRDAAPKLDAAESSRFINDVLDSGVKLIDIVDRSADGAISNLVGTAVRPRREEALVAVRLGWHPRTALRAQCHEMLHRLGTDYVDVCFLHRPRPGIPVEDPVGELGDLVAAGFIRHLGFFATTADDVRRAHAAYQAVAVGLDYSLADRRVELGVLPAVRSLGIGIMACRPLAGGLLTGCSPVSSRIGGERLRTAQKIAAESDLGTTRLVLAWLLAQGTDIVPVVGCTDPVHFEMDVAALATRIPRSALDALSEAFAVTPEAPGAPI